jgi:hypothetical protein
LDREEFTRAVLNVAPSTATAKSVDILPDEDEDENEDEDEEADVDEDEYTIGWK